jgi:hypothetical protein
MDGQETIASVPASGEPRVLLRFAPNEPSHMDFAADGKCLLFVRTVQEAPEQPGTDYLHILDLENSTERRLLQAGRVQRIAASFRSPRFVYQESTFIEPPGWVLEGVLGNSEHR